jgi:hypothetical protein
MLWHKGLDCEAVQLLVKYSTFFRNFDTTYEINRRHIPILLRTFNLICDEDSHNIALKQICPSGTQRYAL